MPANWNANGSVTKTEFDNSCTYSFSCNSNFNLHNSSGFNGDSATCTGTDCTDSWLQAELNGRSCWVKCPQLNILQDYAENNITVTEGTHTATQCLYTLSCPENYCTLKLNGQDSDGQVTCNGDTESCKSTIENYDCYFHTCPGTDDENPWDPNGTLTATPSNATCIYSFACNDGFDVGFYDSGGMANNPNMVTPNNPLSSSSGIEHHRNQYKCKIHCSAADTILHGSILHERVSDTACKYTIRCETPAYVCAAGADYCAESGYTCNGVDECNNFITNTENGAIEGGTCSFTCPSIDYVKSKIPGLSTIGRQTNANGKDCWYSYPSCNQCYNLVGSSSQGVGCSGNECNVTGANAWYTGIQCEYVGGQGCSNNVPDQ